MEPQIHRFRGGWVVFRDGLATFAATREEALRYFRQLEPEPEPALPDEALAVQPASHLNRAKS